MQGSLTIVRLVALMLAALMLVALMVVAPVATLGCQVNVDFSGTEFRCQDGACPAGTVCRDGLCVDPATPSDAGTDSTPESGPDAAPDASPLACPPGCELAAAAALCFCSTEESWDEARIACADADLALPRISDTATAQAIRQEVTARGATVGIWLGGRDVEIEGDWRWIANDDLFWRGLADGMAPAGAFADFNDLEPNQFMGNEEDCLAAQASGWNDSQCVFLKPFFCGRP